jgi:hypothetical protein
MKHLITIIFIFLNFNNICAQDIEIYKKEKNDNYELPQIHGEMSSDEFLLLSRNMKMKDMMYAAIVPGYIHFLAQEKKKGYWLLGARGVAYLTIGGVYLDADNKYGGLNKREVSAEDEKLYKSLLTGAVTTIVVTYLYDIIHGDDILHRKQEKIRYNYTLKTQKIALHTETVIAPSLSVKFTF